MGSCRGAGVTPMGQRCGFGLKKEENGSWEGPGAKPWLRSSLLVTHPGATMGGMPPVPARDLLLRGKKRSHSVSVLQTAAAAVFLHPELSTHTAHRKVDAVGHGWGLQGRKSALIPSRCTSQHPWAVNPTPRPRGSMLHFDFSHVHLQMPRGLCGHPELEITLPCDAEET